MLETEYLGLKLKSPVIVSSGPLTQNAVSLKKCEEAGAGAVVLKSIFEEQIEADVSAEMDKAIGSLTSLASGEALSSLAGEACALIAVLIELAHPSFPPSALPRRA